MSGSAAGPAGGVAGAPRRPRVWDCHTDILSKLLTEPIEGFIRGRGQGPYCHYDLARIVEGGVSVMVCALFTRDDACGEHPVVRTLRMLDIAERLERLTEGRVAVARSAREVDATTADGRTALVLSIENGIACLDDLALLRTYHRLGVRAMGLTWNGRNYLADGCGAGGEHSRLTPFGREVAREMERLGMVIDVSHLADGAFWDLLDATSGPLIASHSNVRALTSHRRNLTDAQIAAIAERGGVIGVNFYPAFLEEQPAGQDPSRCGADALVRHVLGLIERAGARAVGIGSDYDGIGQGPDEVADPAAFPALAARLRAAGLDDATLDAVLYGNFRRVFGEVMGAG